MASADSQPVDLPPALDAPAKEHTPWMTTVAAVAEALGVPAGALIKAYPVIVEDRGLVLVLLFVARPLAVWLSTLGQGFSTPERTLLGWAGLRGAVPIVLATFAQSEHIREGDTIFTAVFFVVLVSALVQGTTLEWLARRLGLVRHSPAATRPPIEVGAARGLDLVEYTVRLRTVSCDVRRPWKLPKMNHLSFRIFVPSEPP